MDKLVRDARRWNRLIEERDKLREVNKDMYEALTTIRRMLINSSEAPNILQSIGRTVQDGLSSAEGS